MTNELMTKDMELRSCDFDQLKSYGVSTQATLSSNSDELLRNVNANAMNGIANDVVELVQKLDIANEPVPKNGLTKFFSSIRHKTKNTVDRQKTLDKNLNEIVDAFKNDQEVLSKDIDILEKLKQTTVEHCSDLKEVINVGKQKIQDLENIEIPEAKKQDEVENSIESNNHLVELQSYHDELQRKLDELQCNLQLSSQALVQANIVQASQRSMYSKINQTMTITIPQMKLQLALAINQDQLSNVIKDQKIFDETNNMIVQKNAKDFHKNSVETVKMINNTSVSIETIKTSANELKQTLIDIQKIDQETKEKRKQNSLELEELQKETRALETMQKQIK